MCGAHSERVMQLRWAKLSMWNGILREACHCGVCVRVWHVLVVYVPVGAP